MTPYHLFIGTYTRDSSKGIYALQLDPATGALSAPVVAAETKSPSYLTLSPDRRFLYAVSETEEMAVAFGVVGQQAIHPAARGGVFQRSGDGVHGLFLNELRRAGRQ